MIALLTRSIAFCNAYRMHSYATNLILMALSAVPIALGNINGTHSILTTDWSGGSEKQFLDTTYLNILNAVDLEIELPNSNREKTLFSAVAGAPKIINFFHGCQGGKTINLYEDPETKTVAGSVVDSDTNEIHQITTNAIGETEMITRDGEYFTDETDSFDVPETEKKFGFFGGSRHLAHPPMLRSFAESLDEPRSLGADESMDVMVVWTKRAECKNSDLDSGCTLTKQTRTNMFAKINLAVDETNVAFSLSGINTELRLVHAYLDENYEESDMKSALEDITSTFDGKMDDVHDKRQKFSADLVSFWIDSTSCGLAWVGPHRNYMFSVVNWACATGYFSFGHELVHNVGCNHDRGSEGKCSSAGANFGYRDKNARFRDIMSYDCKSGQCDNVIGKSCTRVQRFSNRVVKYNGYSIGDSNCDCASRVNTNTIQVANYFAAKTNEELVELGQFEYEKDPPTQAPVAENCKAKGVRCNTNASCCSRRCKWRRCT